MTKRVRLQLNEKRGNPAWKKGCKRPPNAGRRKGTPNKMTRELKEAIITAAELYGADGKGKDGVIGYLYSLAGDKPELFVRLLEKLLPLQIAGKRDQPLQVEIIDTREALEAQMRERGLPVPTQWLQ